MLLLPEGASVVYQVVLPESSLLEPWHGVYWAYLQNMGEDYLQSVGHSKGTIPTKSLSTKDSLLMAAWVECSSYSGTSNDHAAGERLHTAGRDREGLADSPGEGLSETLQFRKFNKTNSWGVSWDSL